MKKIMNSVLVVLVVMVCGFGCEIGPDYDGPVIFEDETLRPEGRYFDLNRPIAVGGQVHIAIEPVGFTVTGEVDSVTVSDPGIIEVVEVHARGVVLRALTAGRTTLTATLHGGTVGELEIETKEVATSELKLYPWDPRIALDPMLWADGVVLMEGAATRLYVEMRSDDGTVLTGFGARTPTLSESELADLIPVDKSDFYTLYNQTGTGDLSITIADGIPRQIDVVGLESVARLGLFNSTRQGEGDGTPTYEGGVLEFESGVALLHVDARTADGRYVMGNPGLNLDIVLGEESALSFYLGDEGLNDEIGTVERALNRGRAFVLEGSTNGPESIEIKWGGLTTTIDVQSR